MRRVGCIWFGKRGRTDLQMSEKGQRNIRTPPKTDDTGAPLGKVDCQIHDAADTLLEVDCQFVDEADTLL